MLAATGRQGCDSIGLQLSVRGAILTAKPSPRLNTALLCYPTEDYVNTFLSIFVLCSTINLIVFPSYNHFP